MTLKKRIGTAVKHFWSVREKQGHTQGSSSGVKDYGTRSKVTGGKQLDGFIRLAKEILVESGLPKTTVFSQGRAKVTIPGFFRPTKNWDLLVVDDGHLLAALEFKSQVGSFGNNYNNRTEEAIGNATDLWTAYRDGAYAKSPRPWLGYFFLLQDTDGSRRPVATTEKHFPVFNEFRDASYAKRYELLCKKLVRERLYDSACLLLSDRKNGLRGRYTEPNDEIGFERFALSMSAHAATYAKLSSKKR